MKKWTWIITAFMVFFLAQTTLGEASPGTPEMPSDQGTGTVPMVVRVYYEEIADLKRLVDYDVFEFNNRKEKYVLAAVDATELMEIWSMGFRTEFDAEETANFSPKREITSAHVDGIPGFACYRTVEETFATAESIVTNHPTLASWIDIGDSWEKTESGGLPGYDMRVLKLTNSTTPGPKPKIFIMSALHAREYTTAELNTRWAEYLVNHYGVDADITWLLDYQEVHLLLQSNPDGRKQAETGLQWRKNTNENYCSPTSNDRGADLNRNFDFEWACCGGSSGDPCSITYRGPSAASEPEVQAIQAYVRSIFPDQRGPDLNDPAPANTMGIFVDLHSYGELVLWPWGSTAELAPNASALRTLGRKMAFYNNYTPDQAIGLYPMDGASDDFAYGDLGLAAYTIELGTTFFQACSKFNNIILPNNLPALLYAAKASRAPYQLPAGPDVRDITLSAGAVPAGASVNLSAMIDDTRFNNSNGSEPVQAIVAAEYMIDVPYWDTDNSPTPFPMIPLDGTFDSDVEGVIATIDTTGLSNGRHTVYVRGQDEEGNWGVVSAVFLHIVDAAVAPMFAGYVREAGTLQPLTAEIDTSIANIATTTDPATGYYQMYVIENTYDLTATAGGHDPETVTGLVASNYQQIGQNFYLQPRQCTVYTSTDVPKAISASGTPTIQSVLNIPDTGTVVDINVLDLYGTHTWMSDLDFNLLSPSDTSVQIMAPSCDSTDDFDLNLDDEAPAGTWPCPPTDGKTYRPSFPLSAFDGEDPAGTWTLTIKDTANNDGGSLEGWSLEVCITCPSFPPVLNSSSITISGLDIELSWTDDTANGGGYEIYRHTIPYFKPPISPVVGISSPGTSLFTDNGAAGNADTNYYYVLRALNCDYSAYVDSHMLAEFDYTLVPGSTEP